MKKITTVERYDASGRLVERTVTTEEHEQQPTPWLQLTPWLQPTPWPQPISWPTITCGGDDGRVSWALAGNWTAGVASLQ